MKERCLRYWKEEEAAESIETIILAIVAISLATGVGWMIYNSVKKTQEKESCETSDSPFCVE